MNRFSDYLASAITPQMTLLEKYNAIIEFLKDFDSHYTVLYKHKLSINGAVASNDDVIKLINFEIITTRKEQFISYDDLSSFNDFMKISGKLERYHDNEVITNFDIMYKKTDTIDELILYGFGEGEMQSLLISSFASINDIVEQI